MAYCSVCGAQEAPGQNYCATCGSPTSATGSSTPAPGSSAPAPVPYPSGLTPAPVYQSDLTNQPRIAGFWWRVLAFVLDEIVINVVLYVAFHSANTITYLQGAVISVVAYFLYFGLMVGLAKGQTLGMMVCRMRVVNATDRGPVSFNQAMTRAALYCVLLLLASIYHYSARNTTNLTEAQKETVLRHGVIWLALATPHLLDLLWAAWDKQRQTLHDKFAKTVVVRTR
jgi:uncharacterized RDD family membrane protein YckC